MKKNSYIFLVLIVFLGIFLRFYGIDKENGLWYDEILSYSLAKEPFPFGVIEAVAKNSFQGVFHYLYLALWMFLFGESDMSLRLSSLILGVFLIPAVFFLGKEVHSRGLGLFASLMVSLNPLLIYYSQEVRPYSLLALLGALSVLFVLRAVRNPGSLNFSLLAVINVLILYTYTIGFVFVFSQALILFIYLKFIGKKPLKNFILMVFAVIFLYLPYLVSVINNFSYYYNSAFIEPFFYSKLGWYSILITLQDWFTPMLSGIYRHDFTFYKKVFFNGTTGSIFVFGIILPVIGLFIFGFLKSLKFYKHKFWLIITPCVVFLFFGILAALRGDFCLVTRHTLLVFPPVLFLCCAGLYKISNKKIILFSTAMVLSFYLYNFTSENSVSKWERAGIKPVTSFLSRYDLKSGDFVLVPCHSGFARKYLAFPEILELDYMEAILLDKTGKSLQKLFSGKDIINHTNKNNAHSSLKLFLGKENPDEKLLELISTAVLDLKDGRYFVIVRKTDYAMYEKQDLNSILEDPGLYHNTAMFRMLVSKIVNDTIEIADENLELVEIQDIQTIWKVYVFQKPIKERQST